MINVLDAETIACKHAPCPLPEDAITPCPLPLPPGPARAHNLEPRGGTRRGKTSNGPAWTLADAVQGDEAS
jgi:hypothetical protein